MSDYSTTVKEWNNFKSPFSGMDKYGTPRLEVAMLVRDTVLEQLRIPWTIESGTLLGAWRNGEFILHDDDFDIALYFETDPVPLLPGILKKIKQLLVPSRFDARLVSSYADKIEVFDPYYGNYILPNPAHKGASFHHVTVDLQCYLLHGDVYKALYNVNPQGYTVFKQDIFPIGRIGLEGEYFQAPDNVESFLKCKYGSISCNAKYNAKTGRYEDRKEADIIIGRDK